MTLRAYKEITKWDDNTPNHTYILNEQEQLVGYVKTGTKEYVQFNKPMKQFSKSRRRFVELKPVEKYIGATV
jgi:hypothetical protein